MSNELVTIDNYCEISKTSLKFKCDVTKDQWSKVFSGLKTIEGCVQFWIGDCLKYREQKWGMYEDVAEESGYDKQTLKDIKYVSDAIESSLRNDNLGFHHHKAVAPLEPKQQEEYLQKAVDNDWTVKELREEIKKDRFSKLPKVELPRGKYNVLYVDPPWDVMAGPQWASNQESKDLDYPTMSVEEITALPVGDLSAPDAHLYLWTINKYIPETYAIARAWGFEPSCLLTWCKPPHGIGLGGSYIQTTEFLLFCRKGSLEAKKRIDTSWFEYKRGKHSKKPDEFRGMIDSVSPGKRIELFARNKTSGWDVWGNEV